MWVFKELGRLNRFSQTGLTEKENQHLSIRSLDTLTRHVVAWP